MANKNPPAHDFAPAWLKIPTYNSFVSSKYLIITYIHNNIFRANLLFFMKNKLLGQKFVTEIDFLKSFDYLRFLVKCVLPLNDVAYLPHYVNIQQILKKSLV